MALLEAVADARADAVPPPERDAAALNVPVLVEVIDGVTVPLVVGDTVREGVIVMEGVSVGVCVGELVPLGVRDAVPEPVPVPVALVVPLCVPV